MQLIYANELAHHGIKGQKWGIRRFQPYPSGSSGKEIGEAAKKKRKRAAAIATATAATAAAAVGTGLAISNAKKSGKKVDPKYFERTEKQGKDKPNISPAERVAKDADRATQESVRLAKSIIEAANKGKNKTNHAAGLSDQELRNRINRLRMEQDYNSLVGEKNSKGYDAAMTALNIIGSLSTIGLATVGIISTVKSISNKSKGA